MPQKFSGKLSPVNRPDASFEYLFPLNPEEAFCTLEQGSRQFAREVARRQKTSSRPPAGWPKAAPPAGGGKSDWTVGE